MISISAVNAALPEFGLVMSGKTSRSPRVKPALPWPGFTQADFDPAPFAGGRSVRLVFDLMPTAWRFRAGHRIRLSLAGADRDSFEPSLAQPGGAAGSGGGDPKVHWYLHRGSAQSVLVLPWIP